MLYFIDVVYIFGGVSWILRVSVYVIAYFCGTWRQTTWACITAVWLQAVNMSTFALS